MNHPEAVAFMMQNPEQQVQAKGRRPWRFKDGQFERRGEDNEWRRADPMKSMNLRLVYDIPYEPLQRWKWAYKMTNGELCIVQNHYTEKEFIKAIGQKPVGRIHGTMRIYLGDRRK